MRLDIVVATYNRAALLRKLLESIRVATCPENLAVRIIIVDNNSSDETRDVVRSCAPICGEMPTYLFEPTPGKVHALNRGLGHVSGDLVGLLDDDEQIASDWLIVAQHAFDDPDIGFVSGPYEPDWAARPPSWLPKDYPAVIGWIDAGDEVLAYGDNYDGTMMGGNAVIRRAWIDRVGPFDPSLGRIKNALFTCEDADYHARLIEAGARGYYLPSLKILHHVPPERLTKSYFRRWCFYRGISLAAIDRQRPQPVAYFLGVPRYLAGRAARGLINQLRGAFGRLDAGEAFSGQLAFWDFVGFFVGKHLARHNTPPAKAERVATRSGPTAVGLNS